jgi:Asp-tRNA(Asn)/Glu-tRNA(Gln) amidotransferase A subunit family amidase
MTQTPWADDACSLVEALRRGERSPREEVEATLAAIEQSKLNCFSFVDAERALAAAERADVSLPFGGVPVGLKELDPVAGWPDTKASVVFRQRVASRTCTVVERLVQKGGAIPVGLTTASEFGGLNVSVTKLNGVTHNPWRHGRTVGGSSGGSAAAVAGGLVTLATAADGGGSIRIPAGYTGLVGMKGTYGRIPRGPSAYSRPSTEVFGCLSRSVRDTARYYDVCAGADPLDPWSLPSNGGWEAGLGTHDLAGRKFALVPALGGVTLDPGVEEHLRNRVAAVAQATAMVPVDIRLDIPNLAAEWMMGNVSTLLAELGDRWPTCANDLTDAVEDGLRIAQAFYNLHTAAVAERKRLQVNEAMAAAFERVDFVIAATNPGIAFPADTQMSMPPNRFIDWVLSNPAARLGSRGALAAIRILSGLFPRLPHALIEWAAARFPDLLNMGGLTIVSNIYGNPAVSIPTGFLDGLPIGMQVLARHHADPLLLDFALAVERTLPWPRVATTPAATPARRVASASEAPVYKPNEPLRVSGAPRV